MKKKIAVTLSQELKIVQSANKNGRLITSEVHDYAIKHKKKSAWYQALDREGLWDDKIAGKKYRMHRLGDLIRIVSVTLIKPPTAPVAVVVPTWIAVPSNGDRTGRVQIEDVMNDPDMRFRLLGRVIADLQSIQELPLFEELADVNFEIKKAAAEYDGNKPSAKKIRQRKSSRRISEKA